MRANTFFARLLPLSLLGASLLLGGADCATTSGEDGGTPEPSSPWSEAFDAPEAGSISGVWGSGPDDIFAVGGDETASVMHYDGTEWTAMDVPEVPLLVWSYGFGPDDVYAVGLEGVALHYDGTEWTELNTGTTQDLWGVWGTATDDVWVVGGSVDGTGEVTILHWDGTAFSPSVVAESEVPSGIEALFKVWGIGSKVFAVGQSGLILEWTGTEWLRQGAGAQANDDFVSLWGTSEDRIVAVGGRGNARIATYDGTTWTTIAPSGIGGLNAVFVEGDTVVVGGVEGFVGLFDDATGDLVPEDSGTRFEVHAIWGDGTDRYWAVGGNFRAPYRGVAIVRE